jgi:hypothetical protein
MLILASPLRLRSRADGAAAGPGFRIPLATPGVLAMSLPCLVLAGLVVFQALHPEGGLGAAQAVGLGVLFGSGPLAYLLFARAR